MKTDNRVRERMVFETTSLMRRAIRTRAGIDDVSPADVINTALEGYLSDEMAQVKRRLDEINDVDRLLKAREV